MTYTHVLKVAAGGTAGPLDTLLAGNAINSEASRVLSYWAKDTFRFALCRKRPTSPAPARP